MPSFARPWKWVYIEKEGQHIPVNLLCKHLPQALGVYLWSSRLHSSLRVNYLFYGVTHPTTSLFARRLLCSKTIDSIQLTPGEKLLEKKRISEALTLPEIYVIHVNFSLVSYNGKSAWILFIKPLVWVVFISFAEQLDYL